MAWHNYRLPEEVERGAQGGPGFSTSVIALSSGYEQRNMNWTFARCKYDIGYGIQTKEDFSIVLAFFYAARGRAHSWRFKDWSDFEISPSYQSIGTGTGALTTFQIFKHYTDLGSNTYDRDITKPITGTLYVKVDGVLKTEGGGADYTVDYTTGIITFNGGSIPAAGKVVSVICEFDVPVRFDSDEIVVTLETFEAGAIPSINIVEVRGES